MTWWHFGNAAFWLLVFLSTSQLFLCSGLSGGMCVNKFRCCLDALLWACHLYFLFGVTSLTSMRIRVNTYLHILLLLLLLLLLLPLLLFCNYYYSNYLLLLLLLLLLRWHDAYYNVLYCTVVIQDFVFAKMVLMVFPFGCQGVGDHSVDVLVTPCLFAVLLPAGAGVAWWIHIVLFLRLWGARAICGAGCLGSFLGAPWGCVKNTGRLIWAANPTKKASCKTDRWIPSWTRGSSKGFSILLSKSLISLIFAVCDIWKDLAAWKILLRCLPMICLQFWEFSKMT